MNESLNHSRAGARNQNTQDERPLYSLDNAFSEAGSFGRFQWLMTIAMMVARNSGCFILYQFSFLVMEQEYECRFSSTEKF